MVEQLDDFDFDYRDLALPIRKKPLKFRDEDFEPAARKLKPRQLQTGFGTLARKTLFDLPDAEWLTLISEAGFSAKALSPRSIEQLEVIFRHSATENRLDKSALQNWLSGNASSGMDKVIRVIRGKLFEEIITREFVRKNPDFFLANPNLTGTIIHPLLAEKPSTEFSMPDHLVFSKDGRQATLVGFMEDKKVIFEADEDDLIEQLENEWNLWLVLSQDPDSQSRFRRRVQESMPSFPHRVSIAQVSEGRIWLATTRDIVITSDQLLPWVELFHSSVSSQSIDSLAENFIKKRFLPRLVNSGD